MKIKKIIKNFNFCSNKKEKLIYLITLGKKIPLKKEKIRKTKNILYGCQSNVWLKIYKKNNLFIINGDSDSLIIKGILSLIINSYNNKKIKKIIKIDIYNLFKKIKLLNFLSFSRAISIKLILKNIQNIINKIY